MLQNTWFQHLTMSKFWNILHLGNRLRRLGVVELEFVKNIKCFIFKLNYMTKRWTCEKAESVPGVQFSTVIIFNVFLKVCRNSVLKVKRQFSTWGWEICLLYSEMLFLQDWEQIVDIYFHNGNCKQEPKWKCVV